MLNSDLEKMLTWATKWRVTFNSTKTEYECIAEIHLRPLPLKLENTLLTDLEQHKHLGVILQNNGRWDSHIKSMCNPLRLTGLKTLN